MRQLQRKLSSRRRHIIPVMEPSTELPPIKDVTVHVEVIENVTIDNIGDGGNGVGDGGIVYDVIEKKLIKDILIG